MCVVFFIKQKTAYELRISDWSSDVCSSDLGADWYGGNGQVALAGLDDGFQRVGIGIEHVEAQGRFTRHRPEAAGCIGDIGLAGHAHGPAAQALQLQIGSASCRE